MRRHQHSRAANQRLWFGAAACATALTFASAALALTIMATAQAAAAGAAATEGPATSMGPIAAYRMANQADEVALARSAAPPSISGDAEILVLGEHGYETAVKGKNGFVCLVERSWFASFDDPQFWNPKVRGPDCLNPAAASSVLPVNLERSRWVLSGMSRTEMLSRTRSSTAARQVPAPGAMGYMMSKEGHLSDTDGHWHPHLMFFQPHAALAGFGANLPGSPLLGQEGGPDEPTVLFVPVGKWSDGTPAGAQAL
jgi:hypothetical protein